MVGIPFSLHFFPFFLRIHVRYPSNCDYNYYSRRREKHTVRQFHCKEFPNLTHRPFLVFSGFGSLASARMDCSGARKIRIAVVAIIVVCVIEIILFKYGFGRLVGFSRFGRICLGPAICAPLAFFMGIPFPVALGELGKGKGTLVPWAWGINGFASVTAAVLGTCLAISMGFTVLALMALVGYFLAGLISGRICIRRQKLQVEDYG